MHTVRNRVASKPRHQGKKRGRSRAKAEPAFLLQTGNPPAFPAGLIVPPPRGASITTIPWPDVPPVAAKPGNRRKSAAPKARKPRAGASRKVRSHASNAVEALVATGQPLSQEAPVAMMTEDLLDRALAMKPLAVEDPTVVSPLVSGPPATDSTAPIPRSRALAVAGSGAVFDRIGHWLREARTWLARFHGGGRKADARTRIARANARHRALQSQTEALAALREVARVD